MRALKSLLSIQLVALSFLLCTLGEIVHAELHFEPYAGYAIGELGNSTDKDDLNGALFGVKLGYFQQGLSFGGEYQAGKLSEKDDNGDKTDAASKDLGAFVSYTFPQGFNVHAAYFFKSEMEFDTNPVLTYKGTGSKVGLAYTGIRYLGINFDYINHTYDESEVRGFTTDLTDKVKTKLYMLSVSVPLEL